MAARDHTDVRAGNKRRRQVAAGPAAVCVALAAVGLALTAVVVLVQHKAAPRSSALFAILLAVGVFSLARSRRDADQTVVGMVQQSSALDENPPLEDRRSLALVTLAGGPAVTAVLGAVGAAIGVPEAVFWLLFPVAIAAGTYAAARGARGAEVWAWGLGTFLISMFPGLATVAAVDALLY